MNNLIAGEEDHQSELARLLNIDLSNQAQRTLMYAMEYMKYGNMNVTQPSLSLCVLVYYFMSRGAFGFQQCLWIESRHRTV